MRPKTLWLLLLPFLLLPACSWLSPETSDGQNGASPPWLNSLKHSRRFRDFVHGIRKDKRRPTLEVVRDPKDDGDYPRRKVLVKMQHIQSDLLNLDGVNVVSVNDRKLLSKERQYTLRHASSQTAVMPGHVKGANLILLYSPGRGTLQLLVLETNEILWTRSDDSLSVSPRKPVPPPAPPPPPPWTPATFSGGFSSGTEVEHTNTWTGLQLGGGLGVGVDSPTLSGYGVIQSLSALGAFSWEGIASLDYEWGPGWVTGVEASYTGIGAVTNSFGIPSLSTHSYGENVTGAGLQLGYDLSAVMPYIMGGAGMVSGTGDASGLSATGARMGAGVDWAVTRHFLLYTEWDLQFATWSLPGTTGAVNAGSLRTLPPGTTLSATINSVTMGVLYSFWGIGN
ncbi:MAG: outer membrane protein [Leptospirillia bacterium]